MVILGKSLKKCQPFTLPLAFQNKLSPTPYEKTKPPNFQNDRNPNFPPLNYSHTENDQHTTIIQKINSTKGNGYLYTYFHYILWNEQRTKDFVEKFSPSTRKLLTGRPTSPWVHRLTSRTAPAELNTRTFGLVNSQAPADFLFNDLQFIGLQIFGLHFWSGSAYYIG